MAIFLMVASGLLGGVSNLCMRRCFDAKGAVHAFFIYQLFFSFAAVLLLYPWRAGSYDWNNSILWLGLWGGITLGVMKLLLGKAIESGPSALTFAIVNSASVFPAVIIVLLFSSWIDCQYSTQNAMGSILVILGLLWAGISDSTKPSKKYFWMILALAAFILQVAFLIFNEWNVCLSKNQKVNAMGFVPVVFIVATAIVTAYFVLSQQRFPKRVERFWGLVGRDLLKWHLHMHLYLGYRSFNTPKPCIDLSCIFHLVNHHLQPLGSMALSRKNSLESQFFMYGWISSSSCLIKDILESVAED